MLHGATMCKHPAMVAIGRVEHLVFAVTVPKSALDNGLSECELTLSQAGHRWEPHHDAQHLPIAMMANGVDDGKPSDGAAQLQSTPST